MPADAKSIWIKGTETVERDGWDDLPEYKYQVEDISEYYTTSPFVDQINGVNDTYHAEDKGSTVDFEEFLRIPYENREAVLPLRFSVWGSSSGMTKYSHSFRVITASDAYGVERRGESVHRADNRILQHRERIGNLRRLQLP